MNALGEFSTDEVLLLVLAFAILTLNNRQSHFAFPESNEAKLVSDDEVSWNRYRAYLRFLVQSQVDSDLNAKLDLSGIVQQTLLEAHQAVIQNQATVTLPWLRQALTNNLTDAIRKLRTGKRDVRREMMIHQSIEQSSIRLERMLVDDRSSPSERCDRHEQVLILLQAMENLPEMQREALVLQVWHGKSLAEIAEQLGKTQQAVAGLLKRGLRQLREEMHPHDVGSDDSIS
jgi:RNA polymerase sigma-70 factor (ECF subfamily)